MRISSEFKEWFQSQRGNKINKCFEINKWSNSVTIYKIEEFFVLEFFTICDIFNLIKINVRYLVSLYLYIRSYYSIDLNKGVSWQDITLPIALSTCHLLIASSQECNILSISIDSKLRINPRHFVFCFIFHVILWVSFHVFRPIHSDLYVIIQEFLSLSRSKKRRYRKRKKEKHQKISISMASNAIVFLQKVYSINYN